MKHRRPFARYMRWLGGMLGVYFLITALLSLTVNPWRINNTPLSLDSLDPYREIGDTIRVGKAALANRGDWETIIFGSSRVEIGVDPSHPAFDGTNAINLAMAAANILENAPVAHYTLDRNPKVKTIIFGMDGGDLHTDFDSRKFTRFDQSPFADNNISIERGINQLIGGRSLVDSISTIRRAISKELPNRNQLGVWAGPGYPGNIRAYIESNFGMGFEQTADKWNMRTQVLRKTKAKLFLDLMKRTRREGIEVHVIIPAQHALKQIHPTENEPDLMCWEADLLALANLCNEANLIESDAPPIKLWSFLTFNSFTTEPIPVADAETQRMSSWFDLGHSKTELSSEGLDKMFAGRPGVPAPKESVCVNLLEGSWEEHRKNWVEEHRVYCETHPEDVAWWRGLVSTHGIK